jgi:hypothetical protein
MQRRERGADRGGAKHGVVELFLYVTDRSGPRVRME